MGRQEIPRPSRPQRTSRSAGTGRPLAGSAARLAAMCDMTPRGVRKNLRRKGVKGIDAAALSLGDPRLLITTAPLEFRQRFPGTHSTTAPLEFRHGELSTHSTTAPLEFRHGELSTHRPQPLWSSARGNPAPAPLRLAQLGSVRRFAHSADRRVYPVLLPNRS